MFETEIEHEIHSLKNLWKTGAVRERTFGDRLLFEADTARLARDQIVAFVWTSPRSLVASSSISAFSTSERRSTRTAAGKVTSVKAVEARDGQTYIEITVEPPIQIDPDVQLADVKVFSASQTAPVIALPGSGFTVVSSLPAAQIAEVASQAFFAHPALSAQVLTEFTTAAQLGGFQDQLSAIGVGGSTIRLDTVYRNIQQNDLIVISRGSEFRAFTVAAARDNEVSVFHQEKVEVKIPFTELDLSPSLPRGWRTARSLTVHFNMLDAGKLTRSAKTLLNTGDFAPPGVPIADVVEPIPESVAAPGKLLLFDANDLGALVDGTVQIDANGEGRVQIGAGTPPFTPALRAPVTVFGNLVAATRGESVLNEIIGSGDASLAFQSFTLAKKPLTYFNDPAGPGGRRSTLEVRVNAIKWKEVASFFGAGPEDQDYIVRQNDAGESEITFGDGVTGVRLPTGVDNVTASYRFGAGAAKPPAGVINQLAKPVEGLRRIVNPVAAGGGADADQPKDIRKNAPNSALILGRAVSVPDFEALARRVWRRNQRSRRMGLGRIVSARCRTGLVYLRRWRYRERASRLSDRTSRSHYAACWR